MPDLPYQVAQWRRTHPDTAPPDQLILTQPTPMGPRADQRQRTTCYQYRADRARRSLHGIDTQVSKAEKAIAGQAAIKRNRFVTLTGGTRTVNRGLETKVRALAGWKPYVTNLTATPDFVIGAYHQLWHVEHTFRSPNTTSEPGGSITTSVNPSTPTSPSGSQRSPSRRLAVSPACSVTNLTARAFNSTSIFLGMVHILLDRLTKERHQTGDASHWIETRTGCTIKKLVRTFRRYRQVTINTGNHHVTAEQPLPDDERAILTKLHQ